MMRGKEIGEEVSAVAQVIAKRDPAGTWALEVGMEGTN